MTYSTIGPEIRDQVARLTLNRPGKMNAITMQMLSEIRASRDYAEPRKAFAGKRKPAFRRL